MEELPTRPKPVSATSEGRPKPVSATSEGSPPTTAVVTTTTIGSNGRSLVTRCYRKNNYCSKESLVNTRSCEASLAKGAGTKCATDQAPPILRSNCSSSCDLKKNSEGATGNNSVESNNCSLNKEDMGATGGTIAPSREKGEVDTATVPPSGNKETPPRPCVHYSYLSVSLVNKSSSPPDGVPHGLATPTPRSRYSEEPTIRTFPLHRISQSRPSSPPPATYFPPPRRPSLSLPPSPQSARIHRISLPSNAFMSLGLGTSARSGPSSAHSSPSTSRPRTPTPPPINRRSPRRRSARTPSPRPPLPPQATNDLPAHPPQAPAPPPNRSRQQECQPYKMRMRSR